MTVPAPMEIDGLSRGPAGLTAEDWTRDDGPYSLAIARPAGMRSGARLTSAPRLRPSPPAASAAGRLLGSVPTLAGPGPVAVRSVSAPGFGAGL